MSCIVWSVAPPAATNDAAVWRRSCQRHSTTATRFAVVHAFLNEPIGLVGSKRLGLEVYSHVFPDPVVGLSEDDLTACGFLVKLTDRNHGVHFRTEIIVFEMEHIYRGLACVDLATGIVNHR